MKSVDIRNAFTNYFKDHRHEKISSSSLVPEDDPTLLFANAGMNQFKDYFTGKAIPKNKRATTVQKCVRAGGKHNDLDNVGYTARHHTFFEMLGNFSFGDYFKKDAIHFAWEFLTKELQIPKDKLYVTVHESDDEAEKIWHKQEGVPLNRIFRMGDKDNFWEMGEFGPCGPCSEIFYDHGPEHTDTSLKNPKFLLEDEMRYVEIWNLVFMQFEKTPDGRFDLPAPSVDTGGGLERFAAALQGKYWNYDSDIFTGIISAIEKNTKREYVDQTAAASMRVIADHLRSSTMLITDGVIPSNEGRGYVLRRIIRRAVRHLRELGAKDIYMHKMVPEVFKNIGDEYPQNAANADLAIKFLELEEKKFLETLDNGMKYLNDAIKKNVRAGTLSGDAAFKLYDTYGFPADLTEIILNENKLKFDHKGFDAAMEKQKEASRKSWKGGVQGMSSEAFHGLLEKHGQTFFEGYTHTVIKAKLLAKEKIGDSIVLIFNKSPFYGESGGQIGDTGEIFDENNRIATICDTQKPLSDLIAHISNDADALEVGKSYTLQVNNKRRELTKRNHSATHLLQSALQNVLGGHVKQSGSHVGPDRLRFDFTHPEGMKKEEISQVEQLVNQQITKSLKVNADEMTKDAALEKGAMAFFGEKYGDKVRVLTMGDFSIELCGGTHVSNTGEIGPFVIVSEGSLSSGVRRIEALTSEGAYQYLKNRSDLLARMEVALNSKDETSIERLEQALNELRSKQKRIDELNDKLQSLQSTSLFNEFVDINGINVCITQAPENSDLRKLSDNFVEKNQKELLVLYGLSKEKLTILCRTNKSNKNIQCSHLLQAILKNYHGRGGGKPEMAQGSGKAPKDLSKCQEEIKKILQGVL